MAKPAAPAAKAAGSGGPLVPQAKARYGQLTMSRNTALARARSNSDLTIPGLVPIEGQNDNTSYSQPYQSLGARAVNNLASRLLVTLFPPDQSFFRLNIDEDVATDLAGDLTTVQVGLSKISNKASLLIETSASRPVFMEALVHLIVAGNALVYFPLDGGPPRMYRIDQYVVLRNERGEMIEGVVFEKVYASALDPTVLAACNVQVEAGKENEKLVELYTHIKRDGDNVIHYQEINGILVPQSDGTSPKDQAGWMALRWKAVPGSDWGRAHVSEYVGDLMSLEDLNKAIIQFAAVASRIVHIVDPNSMIDIEELNNAETGDYVTGYRDKIGTLQLEKAQDFQIADNVAQRVELRLSQAFLLQTGTVRDAERVTAEEIRAMAEELENILGGVYTVLSAEFQLPLVRRLMYILVRNNAVPELPKTIQPSIVTGFEAMGRTHSANKLRAWMTDMINIYGPQVVAQITDPTEVGKRFADSYGIESINTLIKSQEAQAQEKQGEQVNAATMAAVPQLAKGAMDAVNKDGGASADAAPPPQQGAAQ